MQLTDMQRETLGQMKEALTSHRQTAEQAGFDMLAYLLEMAIIETGDILQRGGDLSRGSELLAILGQDRRQPQ